MDAVAIRQLCHNWGIKGCIGCIANADVDVGVRCNSKQYQYWAMYMHPKCSSCDVPKAVPSTKLRFVTTKLNIAWQVTRELIFPTVRFLRKNYVNPLFPGGFHSMISNNIFIINIRNISAAVQWLEMHFIMRMTMSDQGTSSCFALSQHDIVCTNVDHACIRHLGINELITTTTILDWLVNQEPGPYPEKFCLLENE